MWTGKRRWAVILACVGIPALVVLTAAGADETPTKVDPTFPKTCEAILRQVGLGQVAGAVTAATTLAGTAGSTFEEHTCATAVLDGLAGAGMPVADLDFSQNRRCELGRALEEQGAVAAAQAVYGVLAGGGNADDAACGTVGLQNVAPEAGTGLPACSDAGRLFITTPVVNGRAAMVAAFADAGSSIEDARCLIRVQRALMRLEGDSPQRPTRADVEPDVNDQCQAAATAALAGDIGEARDEYEALLDESTDPAERACAVGGSSRLPSQPTFADWTFAQADRVFGQVTDFLPEGPLALSEDAKGIVVALVWLVTAGLLLIALRQYIRWRRERTPGPVEIKAIEAPEGDEDATALAEVIRERLARAGVYPSPIGSGIGEVVVDVTHALGVAGDTGRLARLLNAIRGAIEIKTGAVLSVKADREREADVEQSVLIAQLDSAATGATIAIERYTGTTQPEAAIATAYGVYSTLSNQREVRRRTPPHLRWNSSDALRHYHDALADAESGSYVTAINNLQRAAQLEPANVLIHLGLAQNHLAIGSAVQRDAALRNDPNEAATHTLEALLAATRTVALDDWSEETHAHLGLALGLVRQWKDAWDPDQPCCTEIIKLLRVVEEPSERLDPFDHGSSQELVECAQRLADRHWRLALQRTKWLSLMRRAAALERRRSVQGLLWVWRRPRKSVQDLLRGGLVGTRYDRFALGPPTDGSRGWLLYQLFRVRYGRVFWLRRYPYYEADVLYNLATAYARRSAWLHGRTGADRAARNAVRSLDRSSRGSLGRLSKGDLEYIEADPDFEQLRNHSAYTDWRHRFPEEGQLEITRRAWHSAFEEIGSRADAASRWWYEHLADPSPRMWRWNADVAAWSLKVVSWLGDDLERWTALAAWTRDLAGLRAQEVFRASVPDPSLNEGRPVRESRSPALPGDTKATWKDMAEANQKAIARCHPLVEARKNDLRMALERAIQHVACQNASAIRQELHTVGPRLAHSWAALATWADRPGYTSPTPLSAATRGVRRIWPPAGAITGRLSSRCRRWLHR